MEPPYWPKRWLLGVLEELIDKASVGGVQLDAVQAGVLSGRAAWQQFSMMAGNSSRARPR